MSKKQRLELEKICADYTFGQLQTLIAFCARNTKFRASLPYIISNIHTLMAESEKAERSRRESDEQARAVQMRYEREKREQAEKQARDKQISEIKNRLFYDFAQRFGEQNWTAEEFAEYEQACNAEIRKLTNN